MKGVVVGWATAESPAPGCGAGRDRMTRVLSRSSGESDCSLHIARSSGNTRCLRFLSRAQGCMALPEQTDQNQ